MTSNEAATPEAQYAALQSGRGYVLLDGWASVGVTGADRQKFVHNFCTNDIKRLKPGELCEAFFTTAKGKILAHGVVWCRADDLVIVGPALQAAPLAAHLDRYVIREDVHVQDLSGARNYVLVAGSIQSLGDSQRAIASPILGLDHESLIEVEASDLPAVLETLTQSGLIAVGNKAFETARIEAGFPLYDVDFDADNLPQEVGRDDRTISFTKGCYLGQETVARIDALGHVNQQLVGVRIDTARLLGPGEELRRPGVPMGKGLGVGRATSAAWSPKLVNLLVIAMVRREAAAIGTPLECVWGPGEVVRLPA